MSMVMDFEHWLGRAREVAAAQGGRPLTEADVEHVRLLVDLAQRHRFSPSTLDAKLYWYVTYARPRVGLTGDEAGDEASRSLMQM